MSEPRAAGCRRLLISLLGRYLAGKAVAAYSGTFIDVLGCAGFSTHATRAALSRMAQRGHLERHRSGRKTYFAPTVAIERRLLHGRRRIYETAPLVADWDGQWTLLSFSLPEQRRSERHRLRTRLAWAGFSPFRHGLWIAPGLVDTEALLEDFPVTEDLNCFYGRLRSPASPQQVVARAFDLEAMAGRYRSFLQRWTDPPSAPASTLLGRHLWLITDWRLLLRETQPLPIDLVPRNWPAMRAHDRFHELDQRWGPDTGRQFDDVCDAIPIRRELQ